MDDLKKLIREVPDFPKPGILFYDITTLLKDGRGLHAVIDGLCHRYQDAKVDVVLGVEARGFIFAPALAYALGAGFVPVRKPKKLPAECVRVSYELEYGSDTLEMHKDAVGAPGLLSEYFALLHQGPRWADVRRVEEQEAAVQQYGSFQIEV